MMSNLLKSITPAILLLLFAGALNAQDDPSQRPSPPAYATGKIGKAEIKINYSSPGVKDREIWGGLVPYNELWRTGANEATTFETSADITVNGSALPAGKYSVFTIPGKDVWTVIFNSDTALRGTRGYDESKDVLRVMATPKQGDFVERMQFEVEKHKVVLGWEKIRVPLDVKS